MSDSHRNPGPPVHLAPLREYNFDGLVGPTHNYAGLSRGNFASSRHRGWSSHPKTAALQGLQKMATLRALGIGQALLLPHERPHLPTLRKLGFSGSNEQIIKRASEQAPHLLSLCSSASAMWTANAATVTPSTDSTDGKLHLTAANLGSMFHRSIEAETTTRQLKSIFCDERHFQVHDPVPYGNQLGDEGAANHTRLTTQAGLVHLLAWGRSCSQVVEGPVHQPARQALEASQAVARLNHIAPQSVLFWQQSPTGIDRGAFHTDVLAVGHKNFLMLHEDAFVDTDALLDELKKRLGDDFCFVRTGSPELNTRDAVAAYPFNSQLVSVPDGMCLIAPVESEESEPVRRFLERVVAEDNPVQEVKYLDVRQSMANGGGPACLRLRIKMTADQRQAIQARIFFDEALEAELRHWIERYYPEELTHDQLLDPATIEQNQRALDELTQLTQLGSIYDFQR